MREILFRGRDHAGMWHYGGFRHFVEDCFGRSLDKYYIVSESDYIHDRYYYVVPETISQFVGRYDKNGAKIWENDIVKLRHSPNRIYQVVWDAESAMFKLKCLKYSISCNNESYETNFYNVDSRDVEIVGNIFDNPEILKGGENQ